MTYDGNFAINKTSKVKVPDPKTINLPTNPGASSLGGPLNFYHDENNIYFINATFTDNFWFASKKDPTDLYEQTNFQVAGQGKFLNHTYPNKLGDTNSYWAFGATDDVGIPTSPAPIFRTAIDSSTSWFNTGSTLPRTVLGCSLYADSTDIYIFGGLDSGSPANSILTASVDNPSSWSTSGNTLPAVRSHMALVKVNTTLYLYGGHNGTSAVNTIYSAPISTPTVWTNTGATLPANIERAVPYVNATHVYLYVGTGGASTIYRATVGAPTSFTSVGTIVSIDVTGYALYADTDFIYLYGNNILRAPIADPLTWTDITNVTSTAVAAASVGVYAGRIWSFGGRLSGGTAGTTIQSTESTSVKFTTSGAAFPEGIMGGTLIKTSQFFLIVGGKTTGTNWYFAPLSDPTSWQIGSNGPGRQFGQGFVLNNHVYYYGGETAEGTVFPTSAGMRAVIGGSGNIDENSWMTGSLGGAFKLSGPVPIARHVLFVVGNYVYITGGYVSGPALNTNIYRASIRDLNTTSPWFNVGTLPVGVVDASVAIVGGGLYIIGGGTAIAPFNNTVRTVQYASLADLVAGKASFIADTNYIGTAIAGAGCVCRNDKIWLVGGRTSQQGTTTIEKSSGFSECRTILPYVVGTQESVPVIEPESGVVTAYNQFQLTGMLPWLVTDK